MNLSPKAQADFEALAHTLTLPDGSRPLMEACPRCDGAWGVPCDKCACTGLVATPYVREEVEAALLQARISIPSVGVANGGPFNTSAVVRVPPAWDARRISRGSTSPNPAAIAGAFLAAARQAVEAQVKHD